MGGTPEPFNQLLGASVRRIPSGWLFVGLSCFLVAAGFYLLFKIPHPRHASSAYGPWTVGRFSELWPTFVFVPAAGASATAGILRSKGYSRLACAVILVALIVFFSWVGFMNATS